MNSISIVTSVKNRTKNLLTSLKSWLDLDVQEIIILDFGSSEPLKINIADDRIKVFRYESNIWHYTKANNIAIQLCAQDSFIRVDADYILKSNFLLKNKLSNDKEYIIGIPFTSLAGLNFMYKKTFLSINGYNERMKNYGYNNTDLHFRLQSMGLYRKKYVSKQTIIHIDHDDYTRTQFQEKPELSIIDSGKENSQISIINPWSKNDIMSKL
jgi:hypothetical protein